MSQPETPEQIGEAKPFDATEFASTLIERIGANHMGHILEAITHQPGINIADKLKTTAEIGRLLKLSDDRVRAEKRLIIQVNMPILIARRRQRLGR